MYTYLMLFINCSLKMTIINDRKKYVHEGGVVFNMVNVTDLILL